MQLIELRLKEMRRERMNGKTKESDVRIINCVNEGHFQKHKGGKNQKLEQSSAMQDLLSS